MGTKFQRCCRAVRYGAAQCNGLQPAGDFEESGRCKAWRAGGSELLPELVAAGELT